MRFKIYVLFVSLISFIITTQFKNEFSNLMNEKFGNELCPFFEMPVTNEQPRIFRVISNVDTSVEKCILNRVNNGQNIFVDRDNEKVILNELERQSELPTSLESTLIIGDLLTPDTLFIIEKVGSLNFLITSSSISQGKLLEKMSLKLNLVNYLRVNSSFLSDSIVFFISSFIALFIFSSPIWIRIRRRDMYECDVKLMADGIALLKNGKVQSGSNILLKLARNSKFNEIQIKTKNILKSIG